MRGGAADLPPIRHNDYSPLIPPALGGWDPELPVSVIIPARGGQHRLDLVLAALAAQTYPDHLMEVIVVDDGSEPPLRLPEIVPADTRIVRADPSRWGISHAVNTGAALARGRILQRLDADMVVCREHIEALARWHHLAGYLVTIGAKRFVEEPVLTAARVHEGVRAGSLGSVLDLAGALPSSTEQTISRTDGLRASRNPYHVCTGPTVSMRREIFEAVGGLDPAVLRGEDTEFAYRLAAHGVVFVPDMAAQAAHLGLPAQRRDRDRAVRLVAPYLAHRVPLRRDLRKDRGRHWLVPYVEVVIAADGPAEPVREAVGAALDGSLGDVIVTLVAPWSRLADDRPAPDDPLFDLRLLREHFAHDERVRFADEVSPTPAPIPFRYAGPVSVPLGRDSLERMIARMQEDRSGRLVVDLGGAGVATLDRTEALGRARLLGAGHTGGTGGTGGTADANAADRADRVAASIEATHGVRRGERAEFWPVKASGARVSGGSSRPAGAPVSSEGGAPGAGASVPGRVAGPVPAALPPSSQGPPSSGAPASGQAPEQVSGPPESPARSRPRSREGRPSLLGRLRTALKN
ncbi:glycosyltransferase [Streptosporangium sp. NPDC023615]|uniref:glycosyltransferase n=1 Tax=Streptosporangium sp. NPDC023615 TaxID=3154794 RepID=UPI00344AC654